METLITTGLDFIRWLQSNYPNWQGVMEIISELGRFEVYSALVLFFFWCVDKRTGRHLGYLVGLSNFFLQAGKHLMQQPRPYWVDTSVQRGDFAGYGIPSGHVTSAAVAFLFLASRLKTGWAWGGAITFIALTSLSRMYLGEHFPHDVAGGLLLALTVLGAYALWLGYADEQFRSLMLGQRFWLAVATPAGLLVIYLLAFWWRGPAAPAAAWASFVPAAELDALEEITAGLATLLGLGMGFTLESSRVRFAVDGSWGRRTGRFVVGMVLSLGSLYGLRALFGLLTPAGDPLALVLGLRFVRYFVVALFSTFYIPKLFIWLDLADVRAEPQFKVSINRLSSSPTPAGEDD